MDEAASKIEDMRRLLLRASDLLPCIMDNCDCDDCEETRAWKSDAHKYIYRER